MMTGAEYEAAISRLGLTQEAAGTFLGVAGRTSRRWVANQAPIPEAVALLLRVMVARGLDVATVQATGPVSGDAVGRAMATLTDEQKRNLLG